MNDNYFSKNLQYLRKQKKLTQTELAELIDVDQTTIGRWEDKNREPTIGNVIALFEAFGLTIPDFLGKDLEIDGEINPQNEKLIDLMMKAEKNHGLKVVFEKTSDLDDKGLEKIDKLIDIIKDED